MFVHVYKCVGKCVYMSINVCVWDECEYMCKCVGVYVYEYMYVCEVSVHVYKCVGECVYMSINVYACEGIACEVSVSMCM